MLIDIKEAIKLLKKSQIVAIPTETVYGLAGNAEDEVAVEKIYQAKNRPTDNPLICHCFSLIQIRKYIINEPIYLETLANSFSPGPITFLLNIPTTSSLLPSTRGSYSAAFRIPDHPAASELLRSLPFPLAAPSANTSGEPSPTDSKMVENDLGGKIAGIIEGGQCQIGLESTIIDCRNNDKIIILRPGAIGKDELEELLCKSNFSSIQVIENYEKKSNKLGKNQIKNTNQTEVTPGSKYKHYSPNTSITSINSVNQIKKYLDKFKIENQMTIIITSTEKIDKSYQNINWINLGSQNNLPQIAKTLYLNLRKVDTYKQKQAFFLNFKYDKNTTLGKALRDKLSKIL